MQTNNQGDVALKYYQPQRVLVQKTPTGKDYVFAVRANISMSWIDPADVSNILNRKKGCCGGHRRTTYSYANEDDVRRWTNGGGR